MKIKRFFLILSLSFVPSVASGQTEVPSLQKILADVAAELGKDMPKQMDRSTRAVSVEAEGKVVNFVYVLNVPDSVATNPKLLQLVKAQSVRHNCSNEIVSKLMMVGATMRRTYIVENSNRTFGVDVNWSDCPK